MAEYYKTEICGRETCIRVAGDGQVPLCLEVNGFDWLLDQAEAVYVRDQQRFFDSTADQPELVERSRGWRESRKVLLSAADFLLVRHPNTIPDQDKARRVYDQCANEAMIALKNVRIHFDLQTDPEAEHTLETRAEFLASIRDGIRIFRKQNRMIHSHDGMGEYNRKDRRLGKACARYNRNRLESIPEEEIYSPAKPYPPEPVPENEPVPPRPKAFDVFRLLPPEDLAYDREHHEFYIPEGYVNEALRMDSDSIRWDWESRTVRCKFMGGEPVTWKFWKPLNTREDLEGWPEEYYRRLNRQQENAALRGAANADADMFGVKDHDRLFFDLHLADKFDEQFEAAQVKENKK